MKRFAIAISVAALALPLVAQDKPNTTTTVLAQPPAAQNNEDSPLVRAAKATKKSTTKKSSGIVITNETLLKSGGHIFTANPSNIALPPVPKALDTTAADAMTAAMKAKAEADAKAKREAAAKKDKQMKSVSADMNGESVEERVDDPAAQEHAMDTLSGAQKTSTQPQTMQPAQPQTMQPKPPGE